MGDAKDVFISYGTNDWQGRTPEPDEVPRLERYRIEKMILERFPGATITQMVKLASGVIDVTVQLPPMPLSNVVVTISDPEEELR